MEQIDHGLKTLKQEAKKKKKHLSHQKLFVLGILSQW
jgi:hypothetical protein